MVATRKTVLTQVVWKPHLLVAIVPATLMRTAQAARRIVENVWMIAGMVPATQMRIAQAAQRIAENVSHVHPWPSHVRPLIPIAVVKVFVTTLPTASRLA